MTPETAKTKRETRLSWSLLVVFVIVVICVALWPSKKTPTSEELSNSDLIITDIQAAPIEYQLAYVDSGHLPRGTDINAARIRYLLQSLSKATGDGTQQIAGRTSQAVDMLKKTYGRSVTHQAFLEEANKYQASGGSKMGYSDLASRLTVTMGK